MYLESFFFLFEIPGVGNCPFWYARESGLERHVKNIPVVHLTEWVGSWTGREVTAGIEPRISMLFSAEQFSRHVLP